jgi:hypothetical protein
MNTAKFFFLDSEGKRVGDSFYMVWLESQSKEAFVMEYNEVYAVKIEAE